MLKKYYFVLILLGTYFTSVAQNFSEWDLSFEKRRVFIENIGQFDKFSDNTIGEVKYCADFGKLRMFFGTKGINYSYMSAKKIPKEERAEIIATSPQVLSHSEKERLIGKFMFKLEDVIMNWDNCNSDVEIEATNASSDYFNYGVKDPNTGEVLGYNHARGFEYITYVNIYPNIDIRYEMHPDDGVKYSVILHPGADPSLVKMIYDHEIHMENDKVVIQTIYGQITEHAPFTHYANNENNVINSSYLVDGNSFTFALDSYDNTQEVIIDPWVQNGTFNTSSAAWEVETDGSGNIYVIGGEEPMTLRKYNSAGALQWTYLTPWDTNSVWIGTLATDVNGVSYITSGTTPEIERISSAGAMVWHNSTQIGGLLTEYWSISFNCDNSKLIVGGTSSPPGGGLAPHPAIYDIDITNGNPTAMQNSFTGGSLFNPVEIRSISSSKNAKYIFLTHIKVGAINQNIGFCPNDVPYFEEPNAGALGYKCENYLPYTQNGGGLKALVANDTYFYTHDGSTITQWDLLNGAQVNQVVLPGGSMTNGFGGKVVHCSGLSVDDCGNVYAGATDRVVKFDANLNNLGEYPTSGSFTVYDVCVNSNNEVLAVGAELNNSSANVNRNGRIQSINASTCAKYSLVCCDANICPAGPFCEQDAPYTLDTYTPGGTWSGTGVDASGTFDPSLAGIGNHPITYTLPCGSETIVISVIACNDPLAVCEETNTTLTASGGDGTYSWYDGTSVGTPVNITNASTCTQCGGTAINGGFFGFYDHCEDALGNTITSCTEWTFAWNGTPYATGTNTPAPGSYPILIIDGTGDSLIINDVSELTACVTIPLPIEFESFEVSCQGDGVLCEWATLSELNNDHFEVWKTTINENFEVIGTVAGVGNTNSGSTYRYYDQNASKERAYYRLVQFDQNGGKKTVATRSIDCSDEEIEIYPNPFTGELNVMLGDLLINSNGVIQFMDCRGKVVKSIEVPMNSYELVVDTGDLVKGVYLIKVISDNKTHMEKVIKQ